MNIETNTKLSFHNDMINLYKKISKDLKYKPTKLLDMINKYGGYEAAIKYITSESNTFDFTVLWENERLDLSVEALVTHARNRELFAAEIVSFCDKKLKDYNFSPKKIEVPKEPIEEIFLEKEHKMDVKALSVEKTANVKEYVIYNQPLEIDKSVWKELFMNTGVFTDKNKDLVLRIYLISGSVEAKELAVEEGYTSKYPYKEVVLALGKRIKMKIKIDVPKAKTGELLWWHLLFVGGFKDNQHFEWCIRPELKQAIQELVEDGQVDLEGISVKTTHNLEENTALFELAETQVYNTPKKEEVIIEKVTDSKKEIKKVVTTPSKITGKSLGELSEEELEEFFLGGSKKVDEPILETVVEDVPVHKDEFDEVELFMAGEEFDEFEPSLEELLAIEKEGSKGRTQPKNIVENKPAAKVSELANADSVQEPVASIVETEHKKWEELKKECIEYYGAICEICGFDYGYTYGEAFENKIDIHHIHSKDRQEHLPDTDPVQHLIPICHNCHDIIHAKIPPYTVEEMREMMKTAH